MSAQLSGDLRSQAYEQRRDKEQRVKYRDVNHKLLGKPINPLNPKATCQGYNIWNNANKRHMPKNYSVNCHCTTCRRDKDRNIRKIQKHSPETNIRGAVPLTHRKGRLPALRYEVAIDDFRLDVYSSTDEDDDDDFIEGVAYSYDAPGLQSRTEFSLRHVVSEAVDKFETKELATLIKNEYELVNETDGDEEFEFV
jgi:hypothetical protein